ncbi:ATP-binding protein [Falsibacillus pallidus]|uniref:ATP-binding protein n=1 Tax=Falsibacillus pallidus TaxID=493781 RepID=UPI003D97EDED
MKINRYVKKSLSRKFIFLLSIFAFCFLAGTGVLYYTQKHIYNTYFEEREELVGKSRTARSIYDNYNSVFIDIRGYFAYENESLKENALSKESKIKELTQNLDNSATSAEDRAFVQEIKGFTKFYFDDTLPQMITSYEKGDRNKVKQYANDEGTKKVNEFLQNEVDYATFISTTLNDKVSNVIKKQNYIQIGFIAFILLLLLVMFRIIRVMIKDVGLPLSQFAFAANEIASGKEAEIKVDSKRQDEIGALAVAFKQMTLSIQENEQNLLSQNEELIAQQDELQAQQDELESTLNSLRMNEAKLSRRNSLIHHISTSLDKEEVLESIVVNMSKIIGADRGIIIMTEDGSHSSFGLSASATDQMMDQVNGGIVERLKRYKEGYIVKRELKGDEKGYHLEKSSCHDLHLPILSSENELTAFMVFTRFSGNFHEYEMIEYEALAKQIGVSLEKIKIYEQSDEDRKLNQDILNTVKEGIQLLDVNGTIVQVNDQFRELFPIHAKVNHLRGISFQEWADYVKDSIQNPEDFLSFIEGILKGKDHKDVFCVYTKKETRQVIHVYFEKLYHSGEMAGIVLVHRDITKEFEVDQMKSEFVSTVSHELRTPLASILGFTELMLNKELKTERKQKYLTTILNEAKRLTALINDFLDVQKMESGKQTYEKKYFKLIPLVRNVIENQKVNTDIHDIKIETSIDQDLILGDRSKIEQVFTNLISNAVKYSPNGGDINIRMYPDGYSLIVDIVDNGLGIPPEAVPNIFSKFYRVDNSDRRRIGGTGLGLSIVQEIMRAHEGEVSVSSTFGKGSVFTLIFPMGTNLNEVEQKCLEDHEGNNGHRIMVIEDDSSLADLILTELRDNGFIVQHFVKGREALSAFEHCVPDAVILDILLEKEDGFDGWQIMKFMKDDDRLSSIPIIISSALDEKKKALELGAADYLIKPYQTTHLSNAILHTLLKTGKVGQILIPQDE